MQLQLWLPESPALGAATWEVLTAEERWAAVAALARVMAKSISAPEEDSDD